MFLLILVKVIRYFEKCQKSDCDKMYRYTVFSAGLNINITLKLAAYLVRFALSLYLYQTIL